MLVIAPSYLEVGASGKPGAVHTDYDHAVGIVSEATARTVPVAPRFPEMSFGWLVERYLKTTQFAARAPGTQKHYRDYLRWMKEQWGDLPIKSIRKSSIEDIKLALRETPAKANQTLSLFRILLGYAVDMEMLAKNPAEKRGRLPPPKRHQVWEPGDVERFIAAAGPELRLAMGILLHSVQRPADVLAMRVSQVTERGGRFWISLRQEKTSALVDVPVHAKLEPLLRQRLASYAADLLPSAKPAKAGNRKARVVSDLLIPSPEGGKWNQRNFARAWDKALARANFRFAKALYGAGKTKAEVKAELELRHRQRRDLRRTGIVRMAEAGATTPQIAAVSGHSIDHCQKILDTYLPRRGDVALGAIAAWESRESFQNSVFAPEQIKNTQGELETMY